MEKLIRTRSDKLRHDGKNFVNSKDRKFMSINTLSLGSKLSEPMNKVNIAAVAVRNANHNIRLPQTLHEKCVKITI